MKKVFITGIKYLEKYLREDMPQSMARVGFLLIICTVCFVIAWNVFHKLPQEWSGMAMLAGVAFGGKVGNKFYESKTNNHRVNTDKFD